MCKRAYLILLFIVFALVLSACGNKTDKSDSTKSESVNEMSSNIEKNINNEVEDMDKSVEMIMNAGNLDLDSAQGTVETLAEYGITKIVSVEFVSKHLGVVLKITDGKNDVYYLGYGGNGYLEIVRKDSVDGEIIYAPID